MSKWYEKPLRVFDLALEDPCGQTLDQWTAEDILEICCEINANVLSVAIANSWGQAYFKTPQLPVNPRMAGFNRLAEIIDEAHKLGIRTTGRWGPSRNTGICEKHPDWTKCTADNASDRGDACHNSPYGDIVIDTLKHLCDTYAIDGIVFDNFVPHLCYCRFCRDKIAAECNIDIGAPVELVETEQATLTFWAHADAESFLQRAREVCSKHDRVFFGAPAFSSRALDVIFTESDTVGGITVRDSGFEIRKVTARARVDKRPTVVSSPYGQLRYVGLPKPPAHMRQEFREIVISDASPSAVARDWELLHDRRGLAALGTVFGEIKAQEEYLIDRSSLKHVALLLSARATAILGDEACRHVDAAKGWYDVLSHAHVPVDLILDEELTAECLAQYQVLVLGNSPFLEDDQVEAIRTYVNSGGGLIAGHRTSQYDGSGLSRHSFALGDVFGCELQDVMDEAWTYIGFPSEHPLSDGFGIDTPVMHGEIEDGVTPGVREQMKVRPRGGNVVATIHDSVAPVDNGLPRGRTPAMPGLDTGYPAAVVNDFGAGKSVYFAGQVDRLFHRTGYSVYKRLLLNCIALAAGPPIIRINAPTTVEATFYEQAGTNRTVIHLLNHSYDQTFHAGVFRPVGDIIPIHDIRVSLHLPDGIRTKKAYSLVAEETYQVEDGAFVIRELAEYEVVVLELSD